MCRTTDTWRGLPSPYRYGICSPGSGMGILQNSTLHYGCYNSVNVDVKWNLHSLPSVISCCWRRCRWPQTDRADGWVDKVGGGFVSAVRCGDANWIGVWSRCLRLFVANSQIVLSFFVIKWWVREKERVMWRMTASVRLGIYGCLSHSVKLFLSRSPPLSFSLYVSLTHSHDFLSLSLVRFICANIYAELSCQLMSHSCPASALVPCVCVCLWWCVKL